MRLMEKSTKVSGFVLPVVYGTALMQAGGGSPLPCSRRAATFARRRVRQKGQSRTLEFSVDIECLKQRHRAIRHLRPET
jgi:hypothetical protein